MKLLTMIMLLVLTGCGTEGTPPPSVLEDCIMMGGKCVIFQDPVHISQINALSGDWKLSLEPVTNHLLATATAKGLTLSSADITVVLYVYKDYRHPFTIVRKFKIYQNGILRWNGASQEWSWTTILSDIRSRLDSKIQDRDFTATIDFETFKITNF